VPNDLAIGDAVLEIIAPDAPRRSVRITQSPFLIGRGGGTGNQLQLSDARISRSAAALLFDGSYCLEDRGQRGGIFLNGKKIVKQAVEDGDVITFGLDGSYQIVFRTSASSATVDHLLSRIESITPSDHSPGGLSRINLLLEATMLLHSQLPLDAVLGTMLDHAMAVTDAERGILLEADQSGSLRMRLARGHKRVPIPLESLSPSQTAVRLAMQRQSSVVTEDFNRDDVNLQGAQSIISQRLRAVVAIPLYAMSRANSTESMIRAERGQFLGILYLDSRRPAGFSKLDRQILDAIASEAASILDNARLVDRERQRQRLEQEISIARDIQQALLPRSLRDFPHLAIIGTSSPCLAVGGDYFDVFPLSDNRTAFLIADVSGKGLGAALLTTMLQGALSGMEMGANPADVFCHINRFLCEHSEVGRYATMFFGILDREGRLEFVNAGHLPPLLLRAGEVDEPFTEGGFPVGLIPDANYVASCVALRPGDTLVLYSDGVTEAMDPDHEMFGVSRLRELLVGKHEAPLETLKNSILESVQAFSRGASQADDITLLIARYRGATNTSNANPSSEASLSAYQ
jgi:sigma-B regulation protein RsbU (phosphoserine phosphatase)